MTDDPDEPVELYRARSAAEAHALRAELDDAGIPAQVDGELLQGIVGEVPGGWVTAPRVLVRRHHLDAAGPLLDEFLSRAEDPADTPGDPDLRCLACRTPMGTADTCPACGWSYAPDVEPGPELATLAPSKAEEPPSEPTAETAPESTPAAPTQAGWGEVAAVLAVGVVPSMFAALPGPRQFAAPPYWAGAVQLAGVSACIAFVTLYLIRRSGEPWGRFGLDRPAGTDLLLGVGMLIVAELVWLVIIRLGLAGDNHYPYAVPLGSTDYALMLIKHAANGFTEELVTRAYLITRLEVLLRSRAWAVVLAAMAFASYHAYQGLSGLAGAFLFGLAYGVAYLGVRRVWPLALGHALINIHGDLLR